jgi:hypothetical protein
MIIQYLGNSISIILVLIAFVMFLVGIYVGYKYSENQLPTPKSLRLQGKYMFFSIASFSLAIFVFEVANNGFSWDIFWFSLGLMIMLSISGYLNYFISLKTATFLKSRNVPLRSLWGYRLIQYLFRKSSLNKNPNSDKED